MTASGRSSGRRAEPGTDYLARGHNRANKGADDRGPIDRHSSGAEAQAAEAVFVPPSGSYEAAGQPVDQVSASHRSPEYAVPVVVSHLTHHHTDQTSGADVRGSAAETGTRISGRRLHKLATELTDRDRAILAGLNDFHFLSTQQIERLFFPTGPQTPLGAARSSRRVLARLHGIGLVERLDRQIGGLRAGSARYILRLSPLGARLLRISTRRRSREPSLVHLAHVLAVAELGVRLVEARRSGLVDDLQLETEPECWRPVVATHGGHTLLKPDLRVMAVHGDHELHWFIEQDNGTEHRPVLGRKCATYRQAWHDGRIQAELGVFPRVLWVVPDERRMAFVESAIRATAGLPSGMFQVTTTDQAITAVIRRAGDDS